MSDPRHAQAADPGELRAALERTPGAGSVELRETHISWVFLTRERAYKLKKPLVLPFLDYGTPARRRSMCAAEIRLNRRLAPAVYLGVRAVVRAAGGLALAPPGSADAIDYVVEMRRFDEHETLAAALDRGELRRPDVARVARTIAGFHDRCPVASPRRRGARAVGDEIARNLEELVEVAELHAERERIHALGRLLRALVRARAGVLDARARAGHTRECHGDLRTEHVVLGADGVEIVDCVEFDSELRTLDVADDLAFLVMDLARLGGERFAEELVADYRAAGGDCGEDRLLALYCVHRALVRAKVLLVRAAQLAPTGSAHGHASVQARALLSLAERFGWRARLPLVLAVCGVPASGKSHLGAELAEASRLARISSDLIRKRLAGIRPTERASPERYRAEVNRATYSELGRRAAAQVAARGGAIVDATFRFRADREAFAASFAGAAPLLFVECQAPAEILIERALRRERDPRRVSDAGVEVVIRERRSWEPLTEVPPARRLALRTDRPVQELAAELIAWLDGRL